MRGPILDTVGIEFEGIGLSQREALYIISNSGLNDSLIIDRDASVESSAVLIPSMGIRTNIHAHDYREIREVTGERVTMGYEVKTRPLRIPNAERVIWKFLSELRGYGDFVNKRAALHIHVGFAYSNRVLINLIKLGLKIDPLLYRIAGMGTRYRGEFNNSTYCRPLCLGPIVSGNRSKYRLLNIKSILDSENVDEFWKHYAINPSNDGGVNRYHPGRYFGINLYALPLHGTIEFRHFNQSFNPLLVISTVKLVRGIAELIFYLNEKNIESLPELNLFEQYPDSIYEKYLLLLIELMRKLEVDHIPSDKELECLLINIQNTPHHVIENVNVMTHIREYNLPSTYLETGYFEKVNSSKVIPAGQVDVHTIGEFSILE